MNRVTKLIVVLALGISSADAADPTCSSVDQLFCNPTDCWLDGCGDWLSSDAKLLAPLQNQPLGNGWTSSVGGELRYRYIDERNRLRPPTPAGRSTYDQYRFNPYVDLNYTDLIQFHVEAIGAQTNGNELPQLSIDENRADLLQYYVDINLADFDNDGKLRFRYGRQFLNYGSQHLISPLGWSNTFRNFEGYRLYYSDAAWNVDAFAVQPVNGAAGNIYRPTSFDTPDQSRWFSGVYATYKEVPHGTLDLYWLWLNEQDDDPGLIDGNRHTIGVRYAGKRPLTGGAKPAHTLTWDLEGAYQFGTEDYASGINEQIQAGFVSTNTGIVFNALPWTPTVQGIFFWGSGDSNPGDGTNSTVSTLFPLGHAYWGQIDNFNGSNLFDYGVHVTVKPHEKLTFLTGWHWFDKAQNADAIYNVAGASFGGPGAVPTTSSHLGNELDLVATYQINKNLQLQAGYFWFWYGEAVTANNVAAVRNRSHAEMFYTYLDWTF